MDPTLEPGMVLVEDNTQTGGKRFRYKPARIKIDTGSAADFVTLEYLKQIKYNLGDMVEIPESEREAVGPQNKSKKSEKSKSKSWRR